MIKIDVITGFLGSGKTTFLLKYADYLIRQGLKIGILEYDHGAINIDFMLLQKLRGENCELEMLSAACDADCHKRRFKTRLISMVMSGYDRIIIEPSGVFDIDEFLDSINESPLDKWCEAGNIITVVDAGICHMNISSASENLLVSQIANAGMLIMSKTQNYNAEVITESKRFIKAALIKAGCSKKTDGLVFDKDWNTITGEDLKYISECGYKLSDYVKYGFGQEENYETVCFINDAVSLNNAKNAINELFSSDEFGNIIRVKGFVRENDQWYLVNSEKNNFLIEKYDFGKDTLIVIGENLNENMIRALFTKKTVG